MLRKKLILGLSRAKKVRLTEKRKNSENFAYVYQATVVLTGLIAK